jgi:L-histidine Nalpha-methyltransferase
LDSEVGKQPGGALVFQRGLRRRAWRKRRGDAPRVHAGRRKEVPAPPDVPACDNLTWEERDTGPAEMAESVWDGLDRTPKQLPWALAYDDRGCRLAAELGASGLRGRAREGLAGVAAKIAKRAEGCAVLLDQGVDDADAARLLVAALRPGAYVAAGVPRAQVLDAARAVAGDVPSMRVLARCALPRAPAVGEWAGLPEGRRIALLGASCLPRLDPAQLEQWLLGFKAWLGADGMLLVAECSPLPVLAAPLSAPVAAFNRHILLRLNQELGADFDAPGFVHEATLDDAGNRLEMKLRSRRRQDVKVFGRTFRIEEAESVATHVFHQHATADLARLALSAGFVAWDSRSRKTSGWQCFAA